MPQAPYLFDGSVEDNIRIAQPTADDEAVRRAATLAGADSFIDVLPEGYRATVGHRGLSPSSGQRQRIALARAFLRDAPLLLLDEPTAHLDAESAAHVLAALDRLMEGRTVVLVTHSHEFLGRADKIVVLDHGRIVDPSPSFEPVASPMPMFEPMTTALSFIAGSVRGRRG